MNVMAFILGLGVGLGIYCWQRYRLKSQLKILLTSLPDTADLMGFLPIASLVRREIAYLHQQCQQREEKLQIWEMLLARAPCGCLWVDRENQLLWCNQQAQSLLSLDRWQPGQVRLLLELVRSYELDCLIEQTRNLQSSQVQEWTFYPNQYAVAGQKESPLAFPSLALRAESFPLPQGQVCIFLENRQPLVELAQSRERIFSDLTHELRTPLTSISLLAEALEKRLSNSERRWCEQIRQETNRLSNLVEEWLTLSQLQANPNHHLDCQILNLQEIILTAWHSLEPLAQQKGVTLSYSGRDSLSLPGDKSRLTQVFVNLFDNGIKHSPPQGEIRVTVQVEEPPITPTITPTTTDAPSATATPYLLVNIIDAGSGFAAADLPYIFERLYRGDPSRTRPSPDLQPARSGSGLGLSIVQEIIQAHGGSIQARNHPETGGAWLQLRLPGHP